MNSPSVPASVLPHVPASSVPASVAANQGHSSHQNIAEHRRLFNYAAARVTSSNKGKRARKHNVPTCSLTFMCMGKCNVDKPPTSVKERTTLCNAGLGDAVITFNIDGDSAHCHGRPVKVRLQASERYTFGHYKKILLQTMWPKYQRKNKYCRCKYSSIKIYNNDNDDNNNI